MVRREYRFVHLWTLSVADGLDKATRCARVTAGRTWSVDSFDWSPDSRRLAFTATKTPDIVDRGSGGHTHVIGVNAQGGADGAANPLVTQPGPDFLAALVAGWLIYRIRHVDGRSRFFHANRRSPSSPLCRRRASSYSRMRSTVNASPVACGGKTASTSRGLSKTASRPFRLRIRRRRLRVRVRRAENHARLRAR